MIKKLLILGVLTLGAGAGSPKIAATLGYPDFSIENSVRTLQDQVQALSEMFKH